MKKFRIIAVLSLIIELGGAAFYSSDAEPLEFIYEHYSIENGLPHNSISDICQDSRGYLWLCTWYGLSRFDGSGFVNYTMLPGDYSNLSHNRILSVREDKEGFLWVLTYDYHLYRFDVGQEKFTAVPDELDEYPFRSLKVREVVCASNGDVWVALSGAGLLRVSPDLSYTYYDNTHEGYVGTDVSALYEDSEGYVYAVSEKGIAMLKEDTSSLVSRSSNVVAFAELQGMLYFACTDHLLAVDMQTREQKNMDLSAFGVGEVTAMTLTGNDPQQLFIGFRDNTIGRLSPETFSLSLRKEKMGRVRYMFPDPENLLWIATEKTGIWSYNTEKDRFRHYEHSNNVMSYYVDTLANVRHAGDRVWIKMNNWGFGYYDRCCDEIVPLNNVKEIDGHRFMNGVACFDADESGVLWMSTVGRGLEKVTVIRPKTQILVTPTKSDDLKSSSEVRAMLRDSKDNLWVATKSRELYRYTSDLKRCTRFPDRSSGDVGVIYSIFEDRDGNIWLGTKGDGLIRMTPDGDSFKWKRFRHNPSDYNSISSNNIYSVEQDKDGRIWVGTYGGALSMLPSPDSETFVTVRNNFPDYPQELGDRVRYLHCMPDGRMLAATVGGLIMFEPSDMPELTIFTKITKIPGDINSLGNNDVIHIFTDTSGETWLCTFGGGLNRIYFEGSRPRFDVISTEDGLASNIVHSAVDDKYGNIWIATESGISRFDRSSRIVTNFSRYDGMLATSYSEATCASLSDGRVAFGTYDHVSVFRPEDFVDVDRNPCLAVSGLTIDGVRTPFQDRIVIPHDYSVFRINFASLNFSSGSDAALSYMLEGYDKDWITAAGSNTATYSRIPPGNYRFVVRHTHSGHVTDPERVSVMVRVRPSIWNSTVSYIIYVLLVGLLLVFLVRMMIVQMKLRNDVRLEQDLNNIKARFFTNISHELRTPLTLILGGIDDIKRKTVEGDVSEYSVNMVQKNAKRMLSLVNQLLDIRTLVNGRMRLKISQFDVVRLVTDVYEDFKDMAAERQMEMRIIKSVDSLLVWGDAIRVEALVYNLLSNAFKYTSDGGKIEIGVLYRDGEQEYRIMVKDNGIGVPKDKQEEIFEPFVRASDTTFKGMASNGIGLSFCKEIVDVHGGKIWVESSGNEGSKFFVRLPMDKERYAEEDIQLVESNASLQQPESPGLSKYKLPPLHSEDAMKVLVVEDNVELRIYIYNSLINRYAVRDASNGREALNIINEGWIPDMVVTDLMMPEMDGIELISNLRGDFNTSHIPILMITAKHEDDTHVKAMKYGADGYIGKPFTMELLNARIDNMLGRRKLLISALSAAGVTNIASRIDITPQEIIITDKDEQLIKKVMAWLEDKVTDADVTVEQLAQHVGMGRTSMYNKIKGLTGKSPVELIQDFRLEKSTYYLKSGQYSVSETSYKVGFSDPGYFSRTFKKHFGITPAEYIKQNKNNMI